MFQLWAFCLINLFFEAIANFSQQYRVFWLWRGWRGVNRTDLVDHFHHLKDDKSQENEVDGNGDEVAVGKDWYPCFFKCIVGSGYTFWHVA